MDTLLYRAADSISERSSRKITSSKQPDREERFVLEHYGNHKSLYTCTILNGSTFKNDRTSMTRSCGNVVSRSQLLLQTLGNIRAVQTVISNKLKVAGSVMRDEGILYDGSFPVPLKTWIDKNVSRFGKTPEEIAVDDDVLKALIGELIVLWSAKEIS